MGCLLRFPQMRHNKPHKNDARENARGGPTAPGSRVLELGGESGTDRHPTVYPGSYVEYVQKLGHEAPGIYS
jgi:hypothetical protein